MRVLFISTYPKESASCRYRILQYFPFFKENGIECEFNPLLSTNCFKILYHPGQNFKKLLYFIDGTMRRLNCLLRAKKFDLVFIHREMYPLNFKLFEKILDFSSVPFVIDIDDAIFLSQPFENRFFKKFKNPNSTFSLVKKSKYVIVCNEYLREQLKSYNSNIEIVPTSLDTDLFRLRPQYSNNKEIVIGWIGSHSTIHYLETLKTVFKKLAERYDFVLKIIGAGKEFIIPGVKVINRDWLLENDVLDFQSLDIGVYPLIDDEWVKGKTGFKTVQYMSVGVPCVCSAVGANMVIVKDGVNGFLASDEDEWIEKLSNLIESPSLREKIGLEGRETVERRFSVRANAPKILNILRESYG